MSEVTYKVSNGTVKPGDYVLYRVDHRRWYRRDEVDHPGFHYRSKFRIAKVTRILCDQYCASLIVLPVKKTHDRYSTEGKRRLSDAMNIVKVDYDETNQKVSFDVT